MAVSHETMMGLLAGKPKGGTSWVQHTDPDNDAIHRIEKRQVRPSQHGVHFGRQGTSSRSTKGRVSILPNGYVKYDWVTAREVAAYKV